MTAIRKKKHVSKKNKKDWRKHCNITDVEEFLEDQRLEERLGKFDAKPDSELFVVDTGGEQPGPDAGEKQLSAKQRKRAKLAEGPKCFEALISTSKVQDPNAKRNHVNPIGSKSTALSKLTDKRRNDKGVYGKKLEVARKNRKIALEKKRKIKQTRQDFSKDLWNTDNLDAKGIPETLIDEFISPEVQRHNVLHERRLRPKPANAKTVTTRAAIDAPHPGVSYNPTFQEHQELLHQVVDHEKKMMKREAHLLRVTNGMFRKVTEQQKTDQWRSEMTAGLPMVAHKEPAAEPDSDTEYQAVNPPVQNKKKDHKARRKQKERLVELERIKREKIDKKKITDLYKLRKLRTTISKAEDRQAKEREERQTKRALKSATEAPTLSAHKTPAKEPDYVDPSSLSGDLRHIAPTTNLLRERYESLQRRGAIAAAKLMMKKKRRVKSYFKAGHKVTDNDVERFMAKAAGNDQKVAGNDQKVAGNVKKGAGNVKKGAGNVKKVGGSMKKAGGKTRG